MSIMEIDIRVWFMELDLCDEWPMIRYPTDGGQREGYILKKYDCHC